MKDDRQRPGGIGRSDTIRCPDCGVVMTRYAPIDAPPPAQACPYKGHERQRLCFFARDVLREGSR